MRAGPGRYGYGRTLLYDVIQVEAGAVYATGIMNGLNSLSVDESSRRRRRLQSEIISVSSASTCLSSLNVARRRADETAGDA